MKKALSLLRSKKLTDTINMLYKDEDLDIILPELSNLHTTTNGHKNNYFIH